MSFISKDNDDEDLYDPLNPNINFGKRRYKYKSSSSEVEDVEEANYDEIEQEEMVSGMIGDREDEE